MRRGRRGTCQVEERHKRKEHKLIHPCNKYLLSEHNVCQAQRQSVGDGMGEGHERARPETAMRLKGCMKFTKYRCEHQVKKLSMDGWIQLLKCLLHEPKQMTSHLTL